MMLPMLPTLPDEPPVVRGRWLGRRPVALLVSLALAGGAVATAAAPAGADAVDDAKATVIAAQQAADAAAVEYEAAIGRYEQVTAEIAALQEQIRKNREEAEGLRAIAEKRALEAYTGRGALEGESFLTDDDPLDGIRREKMLGDAKRREDNAIERLAKLTVKLEDQRSELEVRRAEQEDALAAAEEQQVQVQAQLGAAQQALNVLEEYLRQQAEAQKAREIAASIARSASNRAISGSGGAVVGGIVCPIRGAMSFIDSWGAPRHQGRHQGVDLMAARGTPNVAVVSGSVRFKAGGTSGNGAYLSGDDGNLYYYFHLDSYEGAERRVAQGEVIGYVGNTGDARYTATHTHFEIHPGHGAAVNPYPSVRAAC